MSNVKDKKARKNSTCTEVVKEPKLSNPRQRTTASVRNKGSAGMRGSRNDKTEDCKTATKIIASRPTKSSPSPKKLTPTKPDKKDLPIVAEPPKKQITNTYRAERKNSDSSEPVDTSVNIKSLSKDETPSDGRRIKPKNDDPFPEI